MLSHKCLQKRGSLFHGFWSTWYLILLSLSLSLSLSHTHTHTHTLPFCHWCSYLNMNIDDPVPVFPGYNYFWWPFPLSVSAFRFHFPFPPFTVAPHTQSLIINKTLVCLHFPLQHCTIKAHGLKNCSELPRKTSLKQSWEVCYDANAIHTCAARARRYLTVLRVISLWAAISKLVYMYNRGTSYFITAYMCKLL